VFYTVAKKVVGVFVRFLLRLRRVLNTGTGHCRVSNLQRSLTGPTMQACPTRLR
jgi:hypothetical protein